MEPKLQSTSDGPFIYTQALSVIVIPNDATVDSNGFHDLLIKFERDAAHFTASLADCSVALVPSELELTAGMYRVSLSIGGHQVGEPICITLDDPDPITAVDLTLCQQCITKMEQQPTSGFSQILTSTWWLSGEPEQDWGADDLTLNQALQRLLVSPSNFSDCNGAQFVDGQLNLPASCERVEEIVNRLKKHTLESQIKPSSREDIDSPQVTFEAAIPLMAVLGVLIDPSCTVVLLIIYIRALRTLVMQVSVAEGYWSSLDDKFEIWRCTEPDMSLEGLRKLLSADDGPWRGRYEEQCRKTRELCTATSMRVASGIVLCLTVWWTQSMILSHKVNILGATAACCCWAGSAAVCWRASQITQKMNGQARHLFQLHKRAVSILTHSEECASSAAWQTARSLWEIEYAVVKEFMQVHEQGFQLLDFKVERKHCIAVITVALPAMFRSVGESEITNSFQSVCALLLGLTGLSFAFATGQYLEWVKQNQMALLLVSCSIGYLIIHPPSALAMLGQQCSTLFALVG